MPLKDTTDMTTEEVQEELDRGDAVAEDSTETIVEAQTDEEKAAAKEAADKAAAAEKDKDKTIPKGRFDEAVKKERGRAEAAEARAKELEAKLKVQDDGVDAAKVEKEITELEDRLDQAIADGDVESKKRIRAEIREKTQALAKSEATRQAAYATAVAVERVRYDAALSLLETSHPEINPDDDKFSQEALDEVIELKGAYEAAGMGSTDALKKAAKYVLKTAPAQAKEEVEKEMTAEEKAAKAKADATAEATRREEAIRRGAKAKAQQPAADADKSGKSSDKRGGSLTTADAVKMNEKDFNKLTDEDLARMRGDTV